MKGAFRHKLRKALSGRKQKQEQTGGEKET